MKRVGGSIYVRVWAVMLAAGVVALGLAASVAVEVMQRHLEARLVEDAVQRTETMAGELNHAMSVVRAELRAVALAADSGRPFEVPTLVTFSALALRCIRGDTVVLEAATSSQAEDLMEQIELPLPGEVKAIEGNRLVVAVRTRGVTVHALADVNSVVRGPPGWAAALLPDPAADPLLGDGSNLQQQIAAGGVLARRDTRQGGQEQVQAYTATADGVVLRVVAPLSSARAASWELTRSILLWSSLAVFPLSLLAWLLARAVTSPVRRLAGAVQSGGGGALSLPPLPPDEIGDLGQAIKSLSDRLGDEAQVMETAVIFSRRANLLRDPEQVFAALESALNQALPQGRWRTFSKAMIEDSREEFLGGYSTNLLRFILGSDYEPPAPQAEDPDEVTGALCLNVPVARVPEVGRDGVQLVLRYRERVFGLAVGGKVPDDLVGRAELLCREATSALRNIELIQSIMANEKLAVLGRLVAGISHELNNPLAFVLANLRNAESELEGAPSLEAIVEAREGAERMERIVRDLMALSRGGSALVFEDIDLNVLVRDMVEHWEQAYPHVELTIRARRPVYVQADQERIRQVVENLMIDALEAAKEGESPKVDLRVYMADGRGIVQVSDNGPGIATSEQGRVFDAFFSNKPEGATGTGLGLFLARSLAEAQGGSLNLISSNPNGSAFALGLPLLQRLKQPNLRVIQGGRDDTVPEGNGTIQRPTILVVDDELHLIRALKRWLGRWGDVTGTTDPHRALELAASGSYDLILCDVDMPLMQGEEFLAALRDLNGAMAERLVLMTGAVTNLADDVRVVRKPLDQRTIERLLQAES